jgi:cell division protein ZapA
MSSEPPQSSFKTVEVNIFNQAYSLRTNREVEHIKRIAGLVDERMRLLSGHTTTHDLAKIAIFAALNLADELSDLRDHYESELQALLSDSTRESVEAAGGAEHSDNQKESQSAEQSQSWFDAIFDAPDAVKEAKDRNERLSSKVSAKLQSLRQTPPETPFIIEEDK